MKIQPRPPPPPTSLTSPRSPVILQRHNTLVVVLGRVIQAVSGAVMGLGLDSHVQKPTFFFSLSAYKREASRQASWRLQAWA